METSLKTSQRGWLTSFWGLFWIIVITRLVGALFLPVIDPSEARYAEIARKMVETQDWITLWHTYNLPFWAKPPLSTWLSASGMVLFGINGFAGRFPIFLLSLGILALVFRLASTQNQKDLPAISVLVLFSSVLFYIASATIMTDMPLVFGITLSMVAFWHTITGTNPRLWKYLFFVGQAIGLLAKGPICLALTGLPVLAWVLITRSFKQTWQQFPWILGTLLMMGLAGPWYGLAELKTPGFLNYFIIGEHFSRFLVKGWGGDLYGNAHHQPFGFIWLYWAGSIAPWILWVLGLFIWKRKQKERVFVTDKFTLYLSLWAFAPLLFFTFSRNIIWTYVLPGIPAFTLLLSILLAPLMQKNIPNIQRAFVGSVMLVPAVMLGVTLYSWFVPEALNNQRRLVQEFQKLHPNDTLVYYCPNCHSAEFYSRRKAPLIREEKELKELLTQSHLFVAIRERKIKELPPEIRDQLQHVKTYGFTVLFKLKSR